MAIRRTVETAAKPKRMAQAGGEGIRGTDDLELAEKVATIALSSPLLRRINSEVLRYITRAAALISCDAGEVLAQPKQRDRGLFLVLRGHLGAEVDTAAGVARLETLGPGETCAGEPLVPGLPALPRFRANTPVEVLAIPYGVAQILAARDGEVESLILESCQTQSRAALLAASESLRCDPMETASSLSRKARFVTIRPRECILADGIMSDSVYLLANGMVELAVPHPVSGFQEVARSQPGSLLGRCSLLGSKERAAAWTKTETQLLQVPRRELANLVSGGQVALDLPRPRKTREAA